MDRNKAGTEDNKLLSAFMVLIMTITLAGTLPFIATHALPSGTGISAYVYAAKTDAGGKINSADGAILRKETNTSSAQLATLKHGTKVTIIREIFKSETSTSAKDRWYYVNAGGKKGYVRADLISGISYPSVQATTTDALNYRTGPSANMKKIGTLSKGETITVTLPARLSGVKQIWYRISVGKKVYYVSAQYVKLGASASTPAAAASSVKTASPASAVSKDNSITLSDVSQPSSLYTGQSFAVRGSLKSAANMSQVVAGVTDTTGKWIIQSSEKIDSKSYDLNRLDKNIKFGTLAKGNYRYRVDAYVGGKCITKLNSDFKVMQSEVAAKLLANPTNGGSARYVYTFDTRNCTKLFSVTGHGNAKVPQGMAYTGDKYYLVYGMSNAQSIVTYSSAGKRLDAKKFPFNMGHPNGITWDPLTGQCYIFRGYQYSCYSWNPSNNSFGQVKTPYSSSGIAFDSSTNLLYSSSKSGIRIYSADGKFTQSKVVGRCNHKGTTYVQDCGAANGFVFHGVSGSSKHKTNYLDVYRVSDSKYLGSVKVNIDEIESVIVDNDGYVEILVNTSKTTDYVYRTPLNINDLK